MKHTSKELVGSGCLPARVIPVSNALRGSTTIKQLIAAGLALGCLSSSYALTVNTSNLADIAAFQAGATIETFDSGLTGLAITSYASVPVPAGSQFFSRNISDPNVPSFNSGGASFNNPASNPGTPVGVFNPEGGIAADFKSATNVIGPLIVGTVDAFGPGFMEVRFLNPVSKVGFEVTHGSLRLILKDVNNSNLLAPDAIVDGTGGNFIGISRGTDEIGGVTILSLNQNDSFTLDNFTFARGTTSTSVPEGASILYPVLAGAFLLFAKRRLKLKHA